MDVAEKSTILIVDDIPENLQVLGKILQSSGYNVALAKNGESALQIAGNSRCDLILLDIMMPVMDGFEVCRELKKNKLTIEIPVIFITAKTEVEDIVNGFKVGGVDYITKPFRKEELLVRINNHISLKNAKEIITQQANELREINHAKNKLYAIVSHDLRSPLSAIQSYINMLIEFPEEDCREALHIFKDSVDEMYLLLENLLQWTNAQQKRQIFNPKNYLFKDIILPVVSVFNHISSQKNITIQLNYPENMNIYCDLDMMRAILRNLLSNAIKFSQTGGIIHLDAETAEGNSILVIKDNGIGIESRKIPSLFDIHNIQSTLGTENEKGTGLGLSICKSFVDKHGGIISVESKPNVETIFTVSLPLELAN